MTVSISDVQLRQALDFRGNTPVAARFLARRGVGDVLARAGANVRFHEAIFIRDRYADECAGTSVLQVADQILAPVEKGRRVIPEATERTAATHLAALPV